jgi:hypothetical protein
MPGVVRFDDGALAAPVESACFTVLDAAIVPGGPTVLGRRRP